MAPAAPEARVSDCFFEVRFTSVHLSRRLGALQDVPRAVLHGLDTGVEREGREAPHEGGEAGEVGGC